MKITKKLFMRAGTFVLAGIMMTTPIYAAYEQTANSTAMTLSGQVGCGAEDKTVTVEVWQKDMGLTDLQNASQTDYHNILVHFGEYKTTTDGAYEIPFNLKGLPSGFYDTKVQCECGDAVIEERIAFANPAGRALVVQELIDAINTNTDKNGDTVIDVKDKWFEVKRVCNNETNRLALGIVSDFAADDYSAELLINEHKSAPFTVSEAEKASIAADKAIHISELYDGTVANLFDYPQNFALAVGDLKTLYTKDFVTATLENAVSEDVKGIKYENITAFDDALNKAFVLNTVHFATGWGSVFDVVSVFKTDIGLNRDATETECNRVKGKEYSKYSDLLTAMTTTTSTPPVSGPNSYFSGSPSGWYSNGGGKEETPKEPETINKNIFDDIESVPWATEAIVELAQKGIISGKAVGVFAPNDNITREEFVKLIMLTFFEDAEMAEISFTDVNMDEWYAPYIKMACAEEIISGISDTLFGTGANITREDMCVIAYRTALKLEILSENEDSGFAFGDDGNISGYAKNAVYALYSNGVVNGMSDAEFAPKQMLTRAQAAKIIYALYRLN